MKQAVAVLYSDGRCVCVGPSFEALADAVNPISFPAFVDPTVWERRRWFAEGLVDRSGVVVRRRIDRGYERRYTARWEVLPCLAAALGEPAG